MKGNMTMRDIQPEIADRITDLFPQLNNIESNHVAIRSTDAEPYPYAHIQLNAAQAKGGFRG